MGLSASLLAVLRYCNGITGPNIPCNFSGSTRLVVYCATRVGADLPQVWSGYHNKSYRATTVDIYQPLLQPLQ